MWSLLFSLLLLSCIVVPIREVVNIYFSNLVSSIIPFSIIYLPSNMDMDVNYNIIKGRSTSSSKAGSRNLLVFSNALFILYS